MKQNATAGNQPIDKRRTHGTPPSVESVSGCGSNVAAASSMCCPTTRRYGLPRVVSLLTRYPPSIADRTARCAADLPIPVRVPICLEDNTTSGLAASLAPRANLLSLGFVVGWAARWTIKSTTRRTLSVTRWPDVSAKTLEKIEYATL